MQVREGSKTRRRVMVVLASAAALVGGAVPTVAQAAGSGPAVAFTDWTAADASANTARGTVRGVPVSLSGSDVQVGITDATFTGFASSSFSPALANADAIALAAQPGYAYQLSFGGAVTDPVVHLASVASRIEFPAGTVVSKLAGQDALKVSGSVVTGAAAGSGQNSDANGTVQLKGTFTSIRFTARPMPDAPNGDGFYLQLGLPVPATAG